MNVKKQKHHKQEHTKSNVRIELTSKEKHNQTPGRDHESGRNPPPRYYEPTSR